MSKPITSTVDPITFEILSHRLYQITKEVGITLEHVGGTVNTTQLKDYLAALYLPGGEVLSVSAALMGMHAVCAGFAVRRIIEQFEKAGEINPDDMFLLNDPYLAAIHQSDMYVISPIHYEGKLIGWSATFVHVMDIGAMSPGGNSPDATEICHEGIRIPGIKLVERGKLRDDVFRTVVNMTRQPVMVGLDLKCEIAANNVAKSRMQSMAKQYGMELIQAVSAEIIRYAEAILRKRIAEIPDGSWSDTTSIQAEQTWNVKLTLTKTDDHFLFDFTGTDKQASRGINLPYHATFGCCFAEVLSTFGYDIPKNQGAFGPIQVIAPEGSVMNVKYPGPVSLNTTSGVAAAKYLTSSVLMQALATSEKWKHEVMAPTLTGRVARHAGVSQYNKYYVSTLSEAGGSGPTSYKDGMNSSKAGSIGMNCHNLEWVELNFPLMYLYRRHVTDAMGAGKFRGGAGTEVAMTLHNAPEGKIKGIAFGVAGFRNSGQGIFGGYPGAPSLLTLIEGSNVAEVIAQDRAPVNLAELKGKVRPLGYCDFEFRNGDILCIRKESGGGFGDPLERDPQMVLADVTNGLVSRKAARRYYGVVLEGLDLDLKATGKLRDGMLAGRLQGLDPPPGPLRARPSSPRAGADAVRPLREHLEIVVQKGKPWVRCTRCSHILCPAQEEWKQACAVKRLRPVAAGALLNILPRTFAAVQRYCPSCGVLLDTSLVD